MRAFTHKENSMLIYQEEKVTEDISILVRSFKKQSGEKYQFSLLSARNKNRHQKNIYNSQFYNSPEECVAAAVKTAVLLQKDPSNVINLPNYKPAKRTPPGWYKHFKNDNY